MYKISEQLGHVVAADTQTSVSSLNNAMIAQSRMCATVIEASEAAKLPVFTVQKTLDSLANGLVALATSRGDLANAVRELAGIQSQSTLQPVSFGCPLGPWTGSNADSEKTTATVSD